MAAGDAQEGWERHPGDGSLDDLEARVEELEEKRGRAEAAAIAVREALSSGQPGEPEDLDALAGFGEALRAAVSEVPGAGDGEGPPSLATLKEALEAARAEGRAAEAEMRRALQRLSEAPASGPGPDLLGDCRRRAAALLGGETIESEEDLEVARGLALLVQLNEAPAEEREALAEAAQKLLPADCLIAIGMAAIGQLPLGGEEVKVPAASGEETVDRVGAAAPAEESEVEDSDTAESPEAAAPPGPEEDAPAPEETETALDPAPGATAEEPEPAEPEEDEEPEPEPEHEPSDEEVVETLRALVEERRFGLAHWIARAWPEGGPGLAKAFEAVGYAFAMRSPVGESASRFRELVEEFPFGALRGHRATNILALAAGLRASLLAPFSGAADLLGAVTPSFAEPSGLSELIGKTITVAQRGLSAADMTEQVQSLATAEDNLMAIQARAEEMRGFSKVKFQRASNVWRKWIEPEGLLGSLLVTVTENRTDRLGEVERKVFELRVRKNLERYLDETDRHLRSANRQKPIIADARQKLIERADESLAIVAEWVELSKALERMRRKEADARWQQGLLDDLRTTARGAREEVLAAVDGWAAGTDLEAVAAVALRMTLEEVFSIVVDGAGPPGAEEPAEEILGLDLLRVRGLGLDEQLRPVDELRLRPLLAAAEPRSWEEAFRVRLEETNFSDAARILHVLASEEPELAEDLEKERLARYEDELGHLQRKLDLAERELGAARREGRVSDSDGLTLNNQLTGLELIGDEQDFRGREAAIDRFREDLKRDQEAGERTAREKYQPLLEKGEALEPYRERLQSLLDRGEISTLEEFVLAIDRGEQPPEEGNLLFNQLEGFFPRVAESPEVAAAVAKDEALRVAINAQGSFGALDFKGLKEEEIEPVQAAVDAWIRLASRASKNDEDDLVRILDLIGLTVEQSIDFKLGDKRRKVIELAAQPLGKALVPAFGSGAADGKYLVRLLWERMSDEAIAATIRQIPGEQPIILLCFGSPLSETTRTGVADQLRHQRNRRAVALIDGPAFLYLASKGGRNLATAMRITLPFSAINPYTPFVAGSVPLEMFYGRNRELEEVIDRNGTSFIYGGRRLGKSALLRAAARKFNDEGPGNLAVYVDLKSKGIGEWKSEGEIVGEISRTLSDANVMTNAAAKDPSFEELRNQVRSWLDVESSRRILLLLDECDSFLNADAKAGFRNVNQLKSLMEETDRRFKPVFAGLHQVRRFQRIPNQPLAHLGFPTPVGPLKPQPAYDLITKPLETLGFKFEDRDLPARILTATNYLPSLIQLFCSELVDHMLGKSCGPGSPPYLIASADVDAVYQTPRVVEEMRTRFHLTTHLDPRYRVIANAVAFEALEGGLSVGLSAPEIRAICEEYWAAGFSQTSSDEFRALLEEMDSLGVLFEDEEGRFLVRSPNVLRMLGTAEQIEEQLKASNELEMPQGFEADSFRDSFGGDQHRRRPFTHQQVARLRADKDDESLVRVVVGSAATGIGDAMACLKELAEANAELGECTFFDASREKRLSRFNKPAKKKRRVVAYRLEGAANEALSLISRVAEKVTTPESRSTVVFLIGADAMPIWRSVIAPADGAGGEDPSVGFDVIELKRWSKAGLRAWAQAQDVEVFFSEDERLDELMRVTGGWPMLIDRVVDAYTNSARRDWRKALTQLERWLDSPEGAAELCGAIGFSEAPDLVAAWNALMLLDGEPVRREDFPELAEGDVADPAQAAEVLRSLQVLELDGEGRYVVEPTVARAWGKIGAATGDALA